MAIQLINVGQVANDGTGDDLREAFIKINQNFEELDLRDDEQTTASNLGQIGEGIFAQRLNYDLQFKSLVPGQNISLSSTDTGITIDADSGIKKIIVSTDSGSLIIEDQETLNINGGTGISTRLVGNTLTIDNTSSEIVTDTTPQLGGILDAQGFDITGVGTIDASTFTGFFSGNLEGNVWGIDIRTLSDALGNISGSFDFGELIIRPSNMLEYLVITTDVDQGTILNPETNILIDGGSIL